MLNLYHSSKVITPVGGHVSGCLLDELHILILVAMIKDGMRSNGGRLGSDVLHAEPVPLVKGDHSCALQIHGLKHLGSGKILLFISLVQFGIWRSVTISSGNGSCFVNKLGEGFFADKSIKVCVGINKHLEKRMIQL